MREVYAERHSALVSSAGEELSGWLDVSPIEAGLQTVGWLPPGVDGARVTALAARRGVEVKAIEPTGGARTARHALQLGFAAVDTAELRRGVRVLREVIGDVLAKVGPAGR